MGRRPNGSSGRRRIVNRDRLETGPSKKAPEKEIHSKARGLATRHDERRVCPGCRRKFWPKGKEKHCQPGHRRRAHWRRHHNNYHPKGKRHSPYTYTPVSYPETLCTPCLDAGRRTLFVPRFKGDDRCVECREVPHWKRRSRRHRSTTERK